MRNIRQSQSMQGGRSLHRFTLAPSILHAQGTQQWRPSPMPTYREFQIPSMEAGAGNRAPEGPRMVSQAIFGFQKGELLGWTFVPEDYSKLRRLPDLTARPATASSAAGALSADDLRPTMKSLRPSVAELMEYVHGTKTTSQDLSFTQPAMLGRSVVPNGQASRLIGSDWRHVPMRNGSGAGATDTASRRTTEYFGPVAGGKDRCVYYGRTVQ